MQHNTDLTYCRFTVKLIVYLVEVYMPKINFKHYYSESLLFAVVRYITKQICFLPKRNFIIKSIFRFTH